MGPRIAVLLLAALAPLAAQDAPAEPPPPNETEGPQDAPAGTPAPASDEAARPPLPAPTIARPATVNSVSITAADVALQLRLLGSTLERLDPALREHTARKALAEEILLSQEALRLGVELTEREVEAWWKRRTGELPDYAAIAAATGSTVERQREVARRAALADTYLLHRCGLRVDHAGRLPPEPLLVRVVTITPSQLREAFAQNREMFDRPEALECSLWALPDEPALQAAVDALAAGGLPAGEPVKRTLGLPDCPRLFPPDIAAWLAEARPGAHRPLDARTLLLVTGRLPARTASFAEVQEPLRNLLLNELLQEARQHLVEGLRNHATYWPPDLFEAPRSTPAPVANPAGAP